MLVPKIYIILSLLISSIACGINPTNFDGFEDGDYENFAIIYSGKYPNQTFPNFNITNDIREVISGRYSLKFHPLDAEPSWIVQSNAFYLTKTRNISIDFKLSKEYINKSDWEISLIGSLEDYSRDSRNFFNAKLDILTLKKIYDHSKVKLTMNINDNFHNLNDRNHIFVNINYDLVYSLKMKYFDDSHIEGLLMENNNTIGLLKSNQKWSIPSSIGFFTSSNQTNGFIIFDNFNVTSQRYEIPSKVWVQSPQMIILKRTPELESSPGYWVGSGTGFFDEQDNLYKLWYRVRTPMNRGSYFTLATSTDLLNWTKTNIKIIPTLNHTANPIDSLEKLTVRKINGIYKIWFSYVIDYSDWRIGYTSSIDGINWLPAKTLFQEYSKDPEVIYVPNYGVYYMSLIMGETKNPTYTYMFQSSDGVNWTNKTLIQNGSHTHSTLTFVDNLFYHILDIPEMRLSVSSVWGEYSNFQTIINKRLAGLDDGKNWNRNSPDYSNGVNYGIFIGDSNGLLNNFTDVLLIYQARHSYLNNPNSWNYEQDGKLALTGKFESVFIGVKINLNLEKFSYQTFPISCKPIKKIKKLYSSVPVEIEFYDNYLVVSSDHDGILLINDLSFDLKRRVEQIFNISIVL